jgi:Phage portal protein
MSEFLTRFLPGASKKDMATVNRLEGITSSRAVVLRDRRGTGRAEIPQVAEKGITLGDDPLAIYKPTGAKNVDASKAMGSFTSWTYAAVNAIASEVANIQLRLYQIKGDDHQEQDDHPLLDLLECPNEHMTGIELKYTMMAHRPGFLGTSAPRRTSRFSNSGRCTYFQRYPHRSTDPSEQRGTIDCGLPPNKPGEFACPITGQIRSGL